MKIDLNEIRRKNEMEALQTPYNYCDRWCQRCPDTTQSRCTIYQQELEQKLTALAHGRKEDDLEVMEKVMDWSFEGVDEKMEEALEEQGIDMDEALEEADRAAAEEVDLESGERFSDQLKHLRQHPLVHLAWTLADKAFQFQRERKTPPLTSPAEVRDAEEVLSRYQALIAPKMTRMLQSAREWQRDNDEHCLCDAVAQMDICRLGIGRLTKALKVLIPTFKDKEDLAAHAVIAVLVRKMQERLDAFEIALIEGRSFM